MTRDGVVDAGFDPHAPQRRPHAVTVRNPDDVLMIGAARVVVGRHHPDVRAEQTTVGGDRRAPGLVQPSSLGSLAESTAACRASRRLFLPTNVWI